MRLFSRATTEACSLPPPPIYFPLTNCSFATSNPSYPAEVTQVDSWGIPVKIASPAQSMCLEPSTVVNNVVIMTQDICTNPENETVAQCASRRGGWLDIATALEDFNGTSINELAPDLEWDILNPPGYAKAARTMIQFPTDIQLDSALVALAGAEAANSSVGQLGLGNDSVILKEMIDAGLSPSNGFAYLAGSQSIDSARNGHLIVGGYDKQSVVGNFTNFALNTTWESARLCPLHVTVTGVMLQRAGKEDEPLITSGASIPACIEPYVAFRCCSQSLLAYLTNILCSLDTLLRLPQSNLGFFQLVTGWNNGTTISSDLFVVEPGLYYPAPFEGNLTFTLLGGFTVTIPNSELSGPVHGLDPNGKKSLNENITMVNIFYKGAEQETATLGKVFLSQVRLSRSIFQPFFTFNCTDQL